MAIRILHTSDWHLGRQLYGRRRSSEYSAFLSWLHETIRDEQIDVLLVSGDIFDTTTPGANVQREYFEFLGKLSETGCSHAVIISGNHDSPVLLGAPAALLKYFNIHVVTAREEALLLENRHGSPMLGVIAVPFLHDKDIRLSSELETSQDKMQAYHEAVAARFRSCERQMLEILDGRDIPVVGIAHLFTAGGATVDGDGVRDLYVGSLSHISPSVFPAAACYMALGHLHVPQCVGGMENIRYSGSPLPMGFGEAAQRKQVCIADLEAGQPPDVKTLEIPVFRHLVRICGDLRQIEERLSILSSDAPTAKALPTWIEIDYDGDEIIDDLSHRIERMERPRTTMEIIAVKNLRKAQAILRQQEQAQNLEFMTPIQVFKRCMEDNGIDQCQRTGLQAAFAEIYHSVLTCGSEE